MAGTTFSVSKTVRSYPTLPYEQIKNDILGKRYTLSLVFVGERRAAALNTEYRKKTYVPNVLSFPLDDMHGEIYITPRVAARECKKWDLTKTQYIAYLFIHGCLHLKGHLHGATMEKAEKQYLQRYILS